MSLKFTVKVINMKIKVHILQNTLIDNWYKNVGI